MTQSFLSMNPWTFDQSAIGWRVLQDRRHFAEAAQVIEAYLEHYAVGFQWHGPPLSSKLQPAPHVGLVWFHAGQMHGFSDARTPALKAFELAQRSGWPETAGPGWTEYVQATMDFVRGDLLALEAHVNNPVCSNLKIVQSLHKALRSGVTHYHRALTHT